MNRVVGTKTHGAGRARIRDRRIWMKWCASCRSAWAGCSEGNHPASRVSRMGITVRPGRGAVSVVTPSPWGRRSCSSSGWHRASTSSGPRNAAWCCVSAPTAGSPTPDRIGGFPIRWMRCAWSMWTRSPPLPTRPPCSPRTRISSMWSLPSSSASRMRRITSSRINSRKRPCATQPRRWCARPSAAVAWTLSWPRAVAPSPRASASAPKPWSISTRPAWRSPPWTCSRPSRRNRSKRPSTMPSRRGRTRNAWRIRPRPMPMRSYPRPGARPRACRRMPRPTETRWSRAPRVRPHAFLPSWPSTRRRPRWPASGCIWRPWSRSSVGPTRSSWTWRGATVSCICPSISWSMRVIARAASRGDGKAPARRLIGNRRRRPGARWFVNGGLGDESNQDTAAHRAGPDYPAHLCGDLHRQSVGGRDQAAPRRDRRQRIYAWAAFHGPGAE